MFHVAFLRAVNVAGHGRVTMDAVREAFAVAGCCRVQTCLQSGNVIFDAQPREVRPLMAKTRRALGTLLGEEPEILIRTAREVAQLVEDAPFKAREADPKVKLYVAFLTEAPRRRPSFPLLSAPEALEATDMRGLEVFIVSRQKPNGFFGFPNNFIEARLGVTATTRNWSTVQRVRKAMPNAECQMPKASMRH